MDAAGTMPARDFLLAQKDTDRAKLWALFQRLSDFGVISNREKFKKLNDDLWEFKSHQLRLLGAFRPGRRFLVAHGVRKKKDDLGRSDIERAVRILKEHDATKID